MHPDSIALLQRIETDLGDPESPCSFICFEKAFLGDEQEDFPADSLQALSSLGCFNLLIPQSLGGNLTEPEQLVVLGRLISRRDTTAAIAFGQTMLGSLPIWLSGSATQKARLVKQLQAGGLGCLALTEKEHGSDLLACELAGVATEQGYEISGSKWLINNARMGASATVFGKLLRPGRSPEMAIWWLEKNEAPLRTWEPLNKIRTHGIRGADISGFKLRNHAADQDALILGTEPAIYTVLKTLQISRILCSGFSLGSIDSMYRLAHRFVVDRALYGKRAISIPMVRAQLSTAFARILASEAMAQVYGRAISLVPQQLSLWSALAKYRIPTECEAAGRSLAVVLGARHYVRSERPWNLFQKFMRDSQVVSLFDGSTQVNLSLVAAQVRSLCEGLDRPPSTSEATIGKMFEPQASCPGWPTQQSMQLSNQGNDAIAQTFLHKASAQAFSGAAKEPAELLSEEWRRWQSEAKNATQENRLPHDSITVMELARRYSDLHAASLVSLACWHQAESGQRGGYTPATLRLYLATVFTGWHRLLDESTYEEVLSTANACIERHISFSPTPLLHAGAGSETKRPEATHANRAVPAPTEV